MFRLASTSPGASALSGVAPATLAPVWLNSGIPTRLFVRSTEPVEQLLPAWLVWAVNAALEQPSTMAPLASRPSGTAEYFARERTRGLEAAAATLAQRSLFVVVI